MAEEKINDVLDNEAEAETEAANAETAEVETEETAEPVSKKDKKLKDENKQLKDDIKALNAKVTELDKAKAELAEVQDKYLRICAEYDNFRKRSQKEREGIFTDAYSDALKEILPIFDNLERAAQYTEPEKITEGLQLIFKSSVHRAREDNRGTTAYIQEREGDAD